MLYHGTASALNIGSAIFTLLYKGQGSTKSSFYIYSWEKYSYINLFSSVAYKNSACIVFGYLFIFLDTLLEVDVART